MSEQRHFHRIRFDVMIQIEINGTVHEASLVDISLKGVLIETAGGFTTELGNSCHLTIRLNNSDVVISFDGKVVHVNDGLVGIKIILIDVESMIHLRRLVTLNSENSERVRDELNALFGFEGGC
jgi:hypothetical protein